MKVAIGNGKQALAMGLMLLALVFCSFRVARAGAQDFALVNQTGVEIHAVYVGESGNEDWDESDELLGGRVLKQGQQLNVSFNAETDAALWDIRVEDSEGGFLEFSGINLLKASVVTLGSDQKAYMR